MSHINLNLVNNTMFNNIQNKLQNKNQKISFYGNTPDSFEISTNSTSNTEKVLKNHDFDKYGKNGIPIKYSRENFVKDVWNLINKEIPQNKQSDFLAKFNLEEGTNGVLDGIPIISNIHPQNITEEKMLNLIKKFYDNETKLKKNSNEKQILDSIIKIFPEFTMMIGKPQHGTHIYSVDIHSLKVLQNALNNPEYNTLSNESKEVLKITALMHDFGKKGHVITTGHASLSKIYSEAILDNYNIPSKIKQRVLNQIANHHWFENYNKGITNAEDVAKIFPTKDDITIAKILAKGDFESVNPKFHLKRLTGTELSQAEYEKTFNDIIKNVK